MPETMDSVKRDELFNILCQLSDDQFDPAAKDKLRGMTGKTNEEIKDELLGLIDDIVYCSWSSSFELQALRIIWDSIGGSESEITARNIQFNEAKDNIELQNTLKAKYKWIVDRWN